MFFGGKNIIDKFLARLNNRKKRNKPETKEIKRDIINFFMSKTLKNLIKWAIFPEKKMHFIWREIDVFVIIKSYVQENIIIPNLCLHKNIG